MEKFSLTYFAALFSVALGWFLNELGQWFRTRKEDRKVKKRVLFYLLETYFIFNKLDTTDITNLFSKKILELIPKKDQTTEYLQFINQLYSGIIKNIVEDNVGDSLQDIEENYTKAINELSTIDPITAYRLNGKNKIFKAFDLFHDYFNKLKERFPNEQDLNEKIKLTTDTIKPEILKDSITDLEDEIRAISLSINFATWFRAKKIISRIKRNVREDDEEKIQELFKLIMPKATN